MTRDLDSGATRETRRLSVGREHAMFTSDDFVLRQHHVIFLSLVENILNVGIDCHSALLFCDFLKAAVMRTLFSFSFRL